MLLMVVGNAYTPTADAIKKEEGSQGSKGSHPVK